MRDRLPALSDGQTPAARLARDVPAVAVHLEGGFGDILVAAPVVRALVRSLGRLALDVHCRTPEQVRSVFRGMDGLRAIRPISGYVEGGYDLIVTISHFVEYQIVQPDRLPHDVLRLLRAAMDRFEQDRGLHQRRPLTDGLAGRLAVRRGQTRLSALARSSGLAVEPETHIVLDPAARAPAARVGEALRGQYVTVHDGFDDTAVIAPGGATKCWPLEHWTALVAGLRDGIPVVQLGGTKSQHVPGVDLDLVGRTTLDEAAWIIKQAVLHVDTDSGLAHLAAAVHTRARVLFGPTDAGYFGYPNQRNIAATPCAGCWWSTPTGWRNVRAGWRDRPAWNQSSRHSCCRRYGGCWTASVPLTSGSPPTRSRQSCQKQGRASWVLITDTLHSYAAAKREIMPGVVHRQHKGLNNRAEISHQPTRRRELIMKRFKSPRQVEKFLSTHDQIANVFSRRANQDPAARFHIARRQGFATWAEVTGVAMAA
jgi:hypothetical protein